MLDFTSTRAGKKKIVLLYQQALNSLTELFSIFSEVEINSWTANLGHNIIVKCSYHDYHFLFHFFGDFEEFKGSFHVQYKNCNGKFMPLVDMEAQQNYQSALRSKFTGTLEQFKRRVAEHIRYVLSRGLELTESHLKVEKDKDQLAERANKIYDQLVDVGLNMNLSIPGVISVKLPVDGISEELIKILQRDFSYLKGQV